MAIKQLARGDQHLLFDSRYDNTISTNWFTPTYWQIKGAITGRAKGRGTTLFLETGNENWVLRHYHRGGLPGKIVSDQYMFTGLEKTRPFAEFRLLSAMCEAGLDVPTPVAARVHRSGITYRGDLITAMIPHSRDLHAVLCHERLNKTGWGAVGAAVSRMHRAGVYHHDLNVRNVMIDNQQRIWIIDFDRCEFRTGDSWKSQNIARFRRSLEKEKNKNSQFHWQPQDWDYFLEGLHSA